ncbi:MAG: sigma-70 family RNA polymerase sigma factor [Firmicutes bacterium]|nr:sigma-70 family RNA polymerase sigma factor [Bacillota bacterium]
MTRDEERAIVERAKRGDGSAFELLVLAHQKQVYNLALRMVKNEDDAFDVAQEAFLRAYSALHRFRGDSKFSVWLYRLTSNLSIDFLRKRRRENIVSLSFLNEQEETEELEIPDERFSPETELERRELRARVSSGLNELPAEYRQILVLRELGGLSYEELAETLSLETGTVKSRLFRARKRLCAILSKDGNFLPKNSSDSMQGEV